MKQVTGSSLSKTQYGVSIQQSLDGHSFSRPKPEEWHPTNDPVQIELILPHAALVPETLYRKGFEADLLAANGCPAAENETVVACDAQNGCVALVAVNRDLSDQIAGNFPNARFSTPLEHQPQERNKCVWISRRENLLHVKIYDDNRLLFAEVIPVASETEIAYFIQRLGQVFPLRDYGLLLAGDDPKKIRKWIGKAFKRVLCE